MHGPKNTCLVRAIAVTRVFETVGKICNVQRAFHFRAVLAIPCKSTESASARGRSLSRQCK